MLLLWCRIVAPNRLPCGMATWEQIEAKLRVVSGADFSRIAGYARGDGPCPFDDIEAREPDIQILRDRCIGDAANRNRLSIRVGLPTDEEAEATNAARMLGLTEQAIEVSRESAAASKASAQAAARTAAATWVLAGVTLVLAVIPVLSYCDSRNAANQRQAEQERKDGTQGNPSSGKAPSGFGIAPAGQDANQESQQDANGHDGP